MTTPPCSYAPKYFLFDHKYFYKQCPAHLLHPEQLGVAVLVGNLLHDVEGEGADLLDRVDRGLVLQASVPPLFDQIVVNLKIFSKYTINIFLVY